MSANRTAAHAVVQARKNFQLTSGVALLRRRADLLRGVIMVGDRTMVGGLRGG